jgi:hypothetical protein
MADIKGRSSKSAGGHSQAREHRDRQTLRSSPTLRRLAQTMDRRANLRLARTMPKARQGLGVPQSQGARLPQARFHPPHDAKTMQFKMMFPDRLLGTSQAGIRTPDAGGGASAEACHDARSQEPPCSAHRAEHLGAPLNKGILVDAYHQVKGRLDLAVSDRPDPPQEHCRADPSLFASSRAWWFLSANRPADVT